MSNDKQLAATAAAGAKQKSWFAGLRADVFEHKRPYAILNADTPHDLFHVLDIPVVTNQWWAAVIAAKRLSPDYLDGLNELGFHEDLCRYCSIGMDGAFQAMKTGTVDEGWAKEHHGLWHDDIKAGKIPAQRTQKPAPGLGAASPQA